MRVVAIKKPLLEYKGSKLNGLQNLHNVIIQERKEKVNESSFEKTKNN